MAGILLCSMSYAHASMNTSPAVESSTNAAAPVVEKTPRNPFTTESVVSPAYSPSVASLILQENVLLSQAIKQWAENNHYKLFWNSKKDYLIYNTITLSGKTDDDILQSLGDLFFSENYGLVVKKYEKNHVIVVDEM
ncbi:TPA: TcpQ domain-containing protein [Enterobacter cancerogenus]|nr:TcpQ domain-containing protein [Enterobacter cancerogenus]